MDPSKRIHSHNDGEYYRSWKCVEIPLFMLQKWRRSLSYPLFFIPSPRRYPDIYF